MPFHKAGSLKYYQFSSLNGHGVYHALYTRSGGFSPVPWKSLNFGASVGDDLNRVIKNREAALKALDIKTDTVYDLYQVHSSKVVITDRPLNANEKHLKADAIITNKPDVTLMMRFADCVPILLFDPVNRAIGIVHAGWKGTVDKIVKNAVMSMVGAFNTNPKDIIAAIGPSIGPDHYSVNEDVITRINDSFEIKAKQFMVLDYGKTCFDLWKANEFILIELGVTRIEKSEICTACHLDDWYSHRGENGKTGRFGVVFGLSE